MRLHSAGEVWYLRLPCFYLLIVRCWPADGCKMSALCSMQHNAKYCLKPVRSDLTRPKLTIAIHNVQPGASTVSTNGATTDWQISGWGTPSHQWPQGSSPEFLADGVEVHGMSGQHFRRNSDVFMGDTSRPWNSYLKVLKIEEKKFIISDFLHGVSLF